MKTRAAIAKRVIAHLGWERNTPTRGKVPGFSRSTYKISRIRSAHYGLRMLAGTPPRDQGGRILIATTRERAATLVTRGRAIIACGEQGHVRVVGC